MGLLRPGLWSLGLVTGSIWSFPKRTEPIFKNWVIPGLFFVYFPLFKQTIQFLQQIDVKKSIQYMELGFKPTTFGT